MASEQTSSLTPSELREQFDGMRAVLLIATDRQTNGFDTAYDHFMYDYAGHPITATLPPISTEHPEFGTINHDTLLLASFTNSHQLVVVREARHLPSTEPARYLVVTADLPRKTITRWHVFDTNFSQTPAGLRLELLLSEKSLSSVEKQVDVPQDIDPVQATLSLWEQEKPEHDSPSIVLTPQGCWFIRDIRQPEALSNIAKIHYGLEQYESIKKARGSVAVAPIITLVTIEENAEASHQVAEPVTITAA